MRSRLHLFLAIALISLSLAFPAHAQQLSKEAKIKLLFTIMRPDAWNPLVPGINDPMMKQMLANIRSQVPPGASPEQVVRMQELRDRLADIVEQNTSIERLLPIYVPIYDETFSEDEIDGMLAFYQSPAGQAMALKMPLLMPKIMQAAMARFSQMTDELKGMVPIPAPANR